MSYHHPEHRKSSFNCPHCQVNSVQTWGRATSFPGSHGINVPAYEFSHCEHCDEWCCWFNQVMIMPTNAPVALPHPEMPEACTQDYLEARDIVARSPKAAAAIIRLTLQKLMVELGEKGDHIDKDIQSLVNKGLDTHIQEALDYCRVVGNQAVHPGEIQLDDEPEIAHTLFDMINLIVDDRIARPARVKAAVAKLPDSARKKIEDRAAK